MPSKVAPDDGAVGAAKMGKKKKKKDDEGGKKTTKTDDDPFGKPDEYPDAAAAIIGSKHLVEFHERSDPTKTLATYSMSFGEKLLPREQVMAWQLGGEEPPKPKIPKSAWRTDKEIDSIGLGGQYVDKGNSYDPTRGKALKVLLWLQVLRRAGAARVRVDRLDGVAEGHGLRAHRHGAGRRE